MKKKIFSLLIVFSLALSFCACGTDTSTGSQTDRANSKTDAVLSAQDVKKEYAIGETWTVDGQWSLTVNAVTATADRNEFDDKDPAAVYVIDYTYTNIGYEDENGLMDGLFFSMDDSIVDSAGVMGYSYPGDTSKYPQETPVGATCIAQSCIGVDNAGSFKIIVSKYDGNGTEQEAAFTLNVE